MAEPLRRGQVRWVIFALPDKRRPAVILSRTSVLGYLGAITVAPVTTTIRGTPSEARLGIEDGLPTECVANLDAISTVRRSMIGPLIGSLSESRLLAIEEALLFALGMDRYTRR